MSGGVAWLISRSGAIAPVSAGVLDAAYLVRLSHGSSTREIVIEFEDSCAVVSSGYAEEVARRFVRDAEPPRHLRVDRAGSVTVLVGPRDPMELPADNGAVETALEPRRARNHRPGRASAL
jgi:hypothetical protein